MVAYGALNANNANNPRDPSAVFAAVCKERRLFGKGFLIVSRNDMPPNGLDHNLVFVSGHGGGAPKASVHDRAPPPGAELACRVPCAPIITELAMTGTLQRCDALVVGAQATSSSRTHAVS